MFINTNFLEIRYDNWYELSEYVKIRHKTVNIFNKREFQHI